ncbi:MAG: sulfatase-like hydrolase/transferase, partial [bacterium]|nr:sulfatase-like hydrolase/transferase [bacterium]
MTAPQADSAAGFGGRIGRTHRDSEPWYPPPPPTGGPNVVVVLFDDLGFADLGCYGSEIRTPNLDALAAGGHRYNNFHTTTLCSPSRAC